MLGDLLGLDVVGLLLGDLLGCDVVGPLLGDLLGLDVVGDDDGEPVGQIPRTIRKEGRNPGSDKQ